MFTGGKILRRLDELEGLVEALRAEVRELGSYKGMYEKLAEQNELLFKRLLARDLPELQTYAQVTGYSPPAPYDPRSDVANAGSILEVTDET